MSTCPRCYTPVDESVIFCDEHDHCQPSASDWEHVAYEYDQSLKEPAKCLN